MLMFHPEGPIDIPYYSGKASKTIGSQEAGEFWAKHHVLGAGYGCYVFAIRAGGGITPIYVGKATKSFRQETFTPDKLAKYQRGLADYLKGKPVMFFVMAPAKKGKRNKKLVGELEDFLIQSALSANPDLQNVKGTKRAQFGIAGTFRSTVGKPSQAARSLASCLALERS